MQIRYFGAFPTCAIGISITFLNQENISIKSHQLDHNNLLQSISVLTSVSICAAVIYIRCLF